MPNYGFAIDVRKCIGCHACTVACKAEHEIPIGVWRCWVKTVEKGTFPETRRFFLPVLCNQCEAAPCARICPTGALFFRPDGIVDLDGDRCIGCRACMAACPYSQIFIDPNTHTAEKCNFCANRVDRGLQPACVVVCPTECRIFGDLDDPDSQLSRLLEREATTVRKPEKGTRPKIWYVEAEESAITPLAATRPPLYREGEVGVSLLALARGNGGGGQRELPPRGPMGQGDASVPQPQGVAPKVDYDVFHRMPWGKDVAAYLLTKGISTGAFLVSLLLWRFGSGPEALSLWAGPGLGLAFLLVTAGILVYDLERPARFLYILLKPNFSSWLTLGSFCLLGYGGVATLWLAAVLTGQLAWLDLLLWPAVALAFLSTIYTAFLFAQAEARDLWQGPHTLLHLLAQAGAAGAGALLLAGFAVGASPAAIGTLRGVLGIGVAVHLLVLLAEHCVSHHPTADGKMASQLIVRGPFRRLFWGGAVLAGGFLPLLLLLLPGPGPALVAAAAALAGALCWEVTWVYAGQAVPLA
ncbi:MAG TPA: NrfD/PsrC family molybdoenzyme membrane anchor subunit [Candidatus Methylomirabilis sp.]|jgi:Fe-S-cluster-containing dehydrogenase component/formate-dependent nitrite reductase membrane component NrfD|nr:NrfD/PsrC family molybdoenzyme membrane anchor subunit [Candidatus Methylomirabilis sp.]